MLDKLHLRQSGTSTNLTERLWPFLVISSQSFALVAFIMLTVWVTKFLGGLSWNGGSEEFNIHPFCMVLSMILLNGEGILSYRVLRFYRKETVKTIHVLIQILAFSLAVVGLTAVFQYHNNKGYPNVYSMHSWCGLLTVTLFAIQFVCGLFFFVLRLSQETTRADYLKLHHFFGKVIFAMAVGTALIGIDEELTFKGKYGQIPPVAALGNSLGLMIIIFGVVVMYMVTNSEFLRPPDESQFKNLSELETD